MVGWQLVKKVSPYPVIPVEANSFEIDLIHDCSLLSMTGESRMWALIKACEHVKNCGIKGDFVECGVWKGGNLVLMAKMIERLGLDKNVVGFDTFDGMSEPTDYDVAWDGEKSRDLMSKSEKNKDIENIHCVSPLDEVTNNINAKGVKDMPQLVQGKVEDTLKEIKNVPNRISILRLDTDFYESTKVELEELFPRLQSGGVLIIDDYGHHMGAKKAVDEYFADQKIWMHQVDYSCRLMLKK